MDITPLILQILFCLLLSGFFSGMEIAFVSSNRMLAEMDREKNRFTPKLLAFFYNHPNDFVSTMLVGNNVVLVVYGILFARLFDQTLFQGLPAGFTVPADTLLSTLIVLITAEFLPKILFKANANALLTFFSPIAYLFYIVLWPVSKFASLLSHLFLRLIGTKMERNEIDEDFSRVDLDNLLQSTIDNAPDNQQIDDEVKIFRNALDFSETKVRDCMIPRTEIQAVDMHDCTLQELRNKFVESGHGKLIVYDENIDHVVGYIHSSELFRLADKHDQSVDWRDSIQQIPFVPETMAAQKLMQTLLQEKKSLAIVVDEFGGTSGLVSLEDIVEEIFGEIEDEHDNTRYTARIVGEHEYLLSARMEIDNVNEEFDINLPESDEYKTIGGLILYHYGGFPKLNEVVKIDKFDFKIMKNSLTKIELVRLKVNE